MPKRENTKRFAKTIPEKYSEALSGQGHGVVAGTGGARFAGYRQREDKTISSQLLESSFGCGDPVAFSEIQPGQTVLDLGSGAGLDLLLAAEKVGPQGKVIGVDLSEAMLERARHNAKAAGHANIELRQGAIESLPVQSESVDWIISNCVINLSPHKQQVFAEIARVLRPGGRVLISDIVAQDLPFWVRRSGVLTVACVAGAIPERDYLAGLRAAGLPDAVILARMSYSPSQMADVVINALPSSTRCVHRYLRPLLRWLAKPVAQRLWSVRVAATRAPAARNRDE